MLIRPYLDFIRSNNYMEGIIDTDKKLNKHLKWKNALATFHTHVGSCDKKSAICYIDPPSRKDLIVFNELYGKYGIKNHFVIGKDYIYHVKINSFNPDLQDIYTIDVVDMHKNYNDFFKKYAYNMTLKKYNE